MERRHGDLLWGASRKVPYDGVVHVGSWTGRVREVRETAEGGIFYNIHWWRKGTFRYLGMMSVIFENSQKKGGDKPQGGKRDGDVKGKHLLQ